MLVLVPDAQFEDDAEIERDMLGEGVEVVVHREVVADRIPDDHWRRADALIVYNGVPVDRGLIERLAGCCVLVRAGVGYDHIDIGACAGQGIPVCNVPDYGTTEVADHAIALMLALARGLVSYHANLLADPAPGGTGRGRRWSGACAAPRSASSAWGGSALRQVGGPARWTWKSCSTIRTCPTGPSWVSAIAGLPPLRRC